MALQTQTFGKTTIAISKPTHTRLKEFAIEESKKRGYPLGLGAAVSILLEEYDNKQTNEAN